MIPYKDLFLALHQAKVRYLVAGGFAVNFHGVQRATVDLDLVLYLEKHNIQTAFELLKTLGYEPRLPVQAEQFSDPDIRKSWIQEKGMTVFSFYNPKNPFETLDVFVDEPLPFEELEREKLEVKSFGAIIPVIGKAHLIQLKKQVGRDKDLFDISQLEKLESNKK
jgi:hypothetical protein